MTDRTDEIYEFIVAELKAGKIVPQVVIDVLDRWPNVAGDEWDTITAKIEKLDRELAALVMGTAGTA